MCDSCVTPMTHQEKREALIDGLAVSFDENISYLNVQSLKDKMLEHYQEELQELTDEEIETLTGETL